MIEGKPPVWERAALHRALADEHRVRLVDSLIHWDRTPGELCEITGLSSNLLAFHLGILEEAGIVDRRRSEGDARRRYVRLRPEKLARVQAGVEASPLPSTVVFLCSHNSARSQFAEALWEAGGGTAWSAGTSPARRVHPGALAPARVYGVDLSDRRPKGYEAVPEAADLVVTVCDRALESGVPLRGARMHWSIPDPVDGGPEAFRSAFADIASRVDRLRSRAA
ncbi:MAG: helix-turn-helix domain-containing protein [Actinomycetota bacterium]